MASIDVGEKFVRILPIFHISILLVMVRSEVQRLLIAYIVDLIKVLRELFDMTLKVEFATDEPWLREAFEAYAGSPSRRRIHESIRSKRPMPMMFPSEIRWSVSQLVYAD
jgi:hypothetical protein